MKTTPKPPTPKRAASRPHARAWAAAAALVALSGTAQAAFEGRNASNQVDLSCTATGPTKCTSFYNSTLGFTILNNWNIGAGFWSGSTPPAAGSAQALAASAGSAATGLDGWLLPTGDPGQGAGPLNQYLSIWNAVGGTLAGLQNQFDGVQRSYYWSGTENALRLTSAWVLLTADGGQYFVRKDDTAYAVAVRAGDVAAVVPEPQALALGLVGLGVLAVMRRRRPR